MPTIDAFVQHHATLRILSVKHGIPCFSDMFEMQDASAGGLLGPALFLCPHVVGKVFSCANCVCTLRNCPEFLKKYEMIAETMVLLNG